jgi:hypothetical protein
MSKPYHLMTPAERIAARIASNREIEANVAKGLATGKEAADFARLGHAFLDSLPDMDKGAEAASLLKLGKRMAGRSKK